MDREINAKRRHVGAAILCTTRCLPIFRSSRFQLGLTIWHMACGSMLTTAVVRPARSQSAPQSQTHRPRRSCLYMPGANERALEKARGLPAAAARRLGLQASTVLYQLRHGGASHDLLHQTRSYEGVRARGRWRSDSSVRRHAKRSRARSRCTASCIDCCV